VGWGSDISDFFSSSTGLSFLGEMVVMVVFMLSTPTPPRQAVVMSVKMLLIHGSTTSFNPVALSAQLRAFYFVLEFFDRRIIRLCAPPVAMNIPPADFVEGPFAEKRIHVFIVG
jgi:hypothetical protein